jgi:hypothetical protein
MRVEPAIGSAPYPQSNLIPEQRRVAIVGDADGHAPASSRRAQRA